MARVDQLGICVHPGRPGVYADVPRMIADLAELGVRRVRYRDVATSVTGQLRAAGLHCTVICWTMVETDRAVAAGADRIELRNEWNISGDPGWSAGLHLQSQQTYARYGGRLPILAGALGLHRDFEALGLVPETDQGNTHYYPGGDAQDPTVAAAGLVDVATRNRLNSGAKIRIHSETGFTNGGPAPTSEANAAGRLDGWLAQVYDGGADEAYLYEHLDEGPDMLNGQNGYGLVRYDWTRKPIWFAAQAWLAYETDLATELTIATAKIAAAVEILGT